MRRFAMPLVLLLAAALAGPAALRAQRVGVAGRVGTLGIGAEAAFGLTDRVALRGGIGLSRIVAETTFDDVPVEIELPTSWSNVGLDLYLNDAFRLGGGVLFKPQEITLRGTFEGAVDIGGEVLTPEELGVLTGQVAAFKRAPYVLIGFGKHTAAGFGLSLDLGAAYLGEPEVSLGAQGGTRGVSELDALLARETEDFEGDMKTYLRIWPILSLGLRFGLR